MNPLWIFALVGTGLFFLARKASATAAPPVPYPGSDALFGGFSRTVQNVFPFGPSAPPPTLALDASANGAALDASASGAVIALHPGETVTVTVPYVPGQGVGWITSIHDAVSGSDEGNSALYPFGYQAPGTAPNTITFGYVAIQPGTTTVYVTPQTGYGNAGAAQWSATFKIT